MTDSLSQPEPPDADVERAVTLARWLDKRWIDPIVGLIVPGVGDLAAAALGLYIIGIAISKRVSKVIIARMVLNVAIDALLGIIPIVGDAFDFIYRANLRNVALLEKRHEARAATASDWLVVLAAVATLVAALALPIYAIYRFVTWL